MKRIFLITICLLLTPSMALADSINLRVFFPEPIGSYERIQLVPNKDIGVGTACPVGTIALEQDQDPLDTDDAKIFVCYYDKMALPPDDTDPEKGKWKLLQDTWSYTEDDTYPEEGRTIYFTDAAPSFNSKMGIGTGTDVPRFKLTLDQDGGILALDDIDDPKLSVLPTATSSSPNSLTAGVRLLWYPKKAALRAGATLYSPPSAALAFYESFGTQWSDANIGKYSAAFGLNNQSSAESAMILGGENNIINSTSKSSIIAGGHSNTIDNDSDDDFVTIGGGFKNQIDATSSSSPSSYSFIGGGVGNYITNAQGAVIVGGGKINGDITSSGSPATFDSNTINLADYSVIGGGAANAIYGTNVTTDYGTIIGGYNNNLGGMVITSSTIGGGKDNSITSCSYCFIGGGASNTINPTFSSTHAFNTIGGGTLNTIQTSDWASILGGHYNAIRNSNTSSAIIGGVNPNGGLNHLIQYGDYSLIIGGRQHEIKSSFSFIGGGYGNEITNISPSTPNYTAMVGSSSGTCTDCSESFITGSQNTITSGSYNVISGLLNTITDSDFCWVGGKNMNAAQDRLFVWGQADSTLTLDQAADRFLIFPPGSGSATGRVGIQTLTPQDALDVAGHTHVTGTLFLTGLAANATAERMYILNTGPYYQFLRHNDLAETFQTTQPVEPGDILVMAQHDGLEKSSLAYDHHVIGIASASPAVVFQGNQTVMAPKTNLEPTTEPAVALKGRVPVKVTLENGPIEPGDPLTTSSTPGHAMKSTNLDKSFGTTIGKALEAFSGGPNGETEGMILTFVTLH